MSTLFKISLICCFFISQVFAQHDKTCVNWKGQDALDVSQIILIKKVDDADFTIPTNFNEAKPLESFAWLSSSANWWGKICIENNTNKIQKSALLLGNWTLHNATVYHFDNKRLIDSIKTGFQVPISEKVVSSGYYQIAPLTFPANSKSEILILFKPFKQFPVMTKPILMPNEKMMSLTLQRRTILSISIGILVIMLFYSLLLFAKMGAHVYLYYFLHLLGGLINVLAWNGFFAPLLDKYLIFQYPLWQIVTLGSWIFYILFLIHLVEGASLSKWFKKNMAYFILTGVLFYLVSLLFLFVWDNLYLSSITFIIQGFLFSLLVLLISFKLLRSKDKPSKYFLIGSIFLALGILYNLFSELLIETNPIILFSDPNSIIIIVLVFEMVFFMLGLAEKMRQQQAKNILQKAKVQELLSQIQSFKLHKNLNVSNSGLESLNEQLTPFVKKCLTIISKNMNDFEFSVSKFAGELHISRVHLHRRLKTELGMSASETIRWVRLTLAANLLKTTDLNVTEVSYKVGFNNLSYFANCFKGQYGLNPSEYRK